MGARSDREAPGTDTRPPVAERTVPDVAREAESAAGPQPGLLAGNAAVARQLRATDSGSLGLRVALGAPAGNRTISRALDGGPSSAPEGFMDRVGTAEGGEPIPDDTMASLESGFGTSLGGVRLHVGSRSAALAGEINANAFTIGQDIYFGNGQYQPGSPAGYQLLAHEVTHTLQQGTGAPAASDATLSHPADPAEREAEAVARRIASTPMAVAPAAGPAVQRSAVPVMRDATDLIPDFILDGIKSAVSEIPGYHLVTIIVGTDPLTHRPVQAGRQELIEDLLTFGPFGPSVSQVLHAMDVIGDVFTFISSGLAEHNLTLARIEHDIGAAWDEVSITKGIDGNIAVVRRYLDAILADITAFVRSIVDKVIEVVRSVIAKVAQPLLETAEIKPVWDLARKVLHYDPLLGQRVDAPTAEVLADFLHLIGKDDVLAQMRERGTLQQTADWLDTQFATFAGITTDLGKLFSDAWDAISPENLPNLLNTLPALAQRAFALVHRIADFAGTVIGKVLELVKESLLGWLSQHAHQTPGYELLTVILGRDPFTGQAVPRSAENLIKGFICLLPGGEATYQHLAESGVIGTAASEIEGEMTRLGISWDLVTNTFHAIWDSLSLSDLLAPIAAFERIVAQFRDPISRLVEFATDVVKVVVTLVLKLMNFPTDLLASIISNAMRAIDDIEKDPLAFLQNMLQALKTGVMGFIDDIMTYLLHGLTSWLFRGLGQIGITMPPDFSLQSILTLVFQVLGVTAEHLWQKLGEHIGQDKVAQIRGAIDKLSGAWEFIKDVQQGGLAAIWHHLSEQLGNLWDTLLGMARDWIMHEIVEKVTAKLISMLDPTGVMAVVNSFVAFFKAVQSAIEYIRDILKIVDDYVTTFAQVAAGNIAPGAEKIKQGLGDAVPIAIGFLANQVGLGDVPEKIVEIIGGLREMVDKAIDWLIDKAIQLGTAALEALGIGAGGQQQPAFDPKDHDAMADHVIQEMEEGVSPSEDFQQVRTEKTTQAKGLEEKYTPMLEPGIALSIVFAEVTPDAEQSHVDFEVVIAPNTTRKKGSIGTKKNAVLENGVLVVDGTRRFSVGDRIQLRGEGGGLRKAKYVITGFEERAVGGGSMIMVRFDTKPPSEAGAVTAQSYGTQWHEPVESTDELSDEELEKQNQNESWGSYEVAKKVLNYRVHEIQTVVPEGKSWEHIVENKAGGEQSSENLALADLGLNMRLGTYFGTVRKYPELALEDIVDPIILREYLAAKSDGVKLQWKLKIYASPDFRVALRWANNGRGKYQVLE